MASCICPAGRNVKLFHDDLFGQLREDLGIPDSFVNEGWSLDELESGGGKGGCLMSFLGSEYIVKELSHGDHHTLLGITESYVKHLLGGDSLLAAILLHFEDKATRRKFFVMQNVLGDGPFLAKYDLKGCNDDKTLELFGDKLGGACSTGKVAAFNIDLVVSAEQREEVLRRMDRDLDWLQSNHLMDYSLIVGVKTGPPGFVRGDEDRLGRLSLVQSCRDGSEVAVCVGIIDFLQQWTWYKKAARCIKCLEWNKATVPPAMYAERFGEHFEERFVSQRSKQALLSDKGACRASSVSVR